jgi:hypothetical protein
MSSRAGSEPGNGAGQLSTGQRLEVQDNQIREAAKWLVGSFAAVGASLIAGSQLSSIGKLPVCAPSSVECTRLWIAVVGAVGALVGVVWAVWTGVALLAPPRLQVGDLKTHWKSRGPIYLYFQANRAQLQGFADFDEMDALEKDAYSKFDQLNSQMQDIEGARREQLDRELDDAESLLSDILGRSDDVVAIANHVHYVHFFREEALKRLIAAAAVTAIGIVAFAWAANPPT